MLKKVIGRLGSGFFRRPGSGRGVSAVRLEASSVCQLKCPLCSTGRGETKDSVVGGGFLRFDDFRRFVEMNPRVKSIELSNFGEIFLNPELKDILRYAHSKKIGLYAMNGVNLNTAGDDILEALVVYGFRILNVSIDGASDDTYSLYRRGGDFNRVIDNIRKINSYKKKHGSGLPYINWQFVLFGHNEHELPAAKMMAKELGMEFSTMVNWTPSFSPLKDRKLVSKETGKNLLSDADLERERKRDHCQACYMLWVWPQINWDGRLLGCCVNMWGDFGDVFVSGLDECLNSERYNYAKGMLLGKREVREDIPCSKCHVYKEIPTARIREDVEKRVALGFPDFVF